MFDGVFSLNSIIIAIVAVALILIAIRVFGKIILTFRFRGAVTVSPWAQKPCPHLGLLDEPFVHRDEPDEEHRCYLWMQRDRIDMTHQKAFCLGSAHTHCPWLTVAPPEGEGPLPRRLSSAVGASAGGVTGTVVNGLADAAEWLAFKIGRGAIVARRRIAKAAPFVDALLVLIIEDIGPYVVVAARYAWELSKMASQALYERYGWTFLRPADSSEDVSRRARSERAEPTFQPAGTREVEPAVAATPSWARAKDAPAAKTAVPSFKPRSGKQPLNHVESFMEQGKTASLNGNRKLAYSFFSLATDLEPKNDEAWLWKGAMTDSSEEKFICMQRALAINPKNEKAQQALRQMGQEPLAAQPRGQGTPTSFTPAQSLGQRVGLFGTLNSEETLMDAGLQALEQGAEENAHDLFVRAVELNPGSEKAWFWRAKTSATLDEVIFCLQQALVINPANEKVQANLLWAVQRQQKEEEAKKMEQKPVAAPAKIKSGKEKRGVSFVTVGLRWLAGLICLALAAYWVMAAVLPLLELPAMKDVSDWLQGPGEVDLQAVRPLFEATTRWLPALTWVALPWHDKFEVASGYNLLAAVPYTVGFLYFFVALGLLRRENWSRFWGLAVTALSLALGVVFSTNSQAVIPVVGLGLATILLLVVSRNEFRREIG